MAVSRWIEHQTGWSIRKFVKTARRYRTIQIQAGPHVAADPLPSELQQALDQINRRSAVHWIPLRHAHILQAGQGALIGAIFDQ
jgi:hypothetical protein